MKMVEIRDTSFDPYVELVRYQTAFPLSEYFGATCVFVGTMRDFNDGETIHAMTLEYYPGMTEKYLEVIISEAKIEWNCKDVLIIHRIGELLPNQTIVLVAAWSTHRSDAFNTCSYVVEGLKHRAPFWKKEKLSYGERWVEKNTRFSSDFPEHK